MMAPERTMTCSQGCDPELLERTHTVVAGPSKEYPVTEYYCQGCGWEAKYDVGSGWLTVSHDPRKHYEEAPCGPLERGGVHGA